ncbi:MAG: hypothetical protein GC185_02900 [Alphaproteobacteria bacterium]|nr:hypothetical protein [Alphaproteobacteria bacterium]
MKHSFFRKSALVLAFAAAAGGMAGCSNQIGPQAKTADLHGTTATEQVFNGGPQQYTTRISASALKADQSYRATGRLTIDGSVPDNVSIHVTDGKLTVNGDLGKGDRIDVSQPIATHNENYPDFCYGYDFMAGKFNYSYKFTGCDHTVVDGLKYNDSEAAVTVTGHVGADVKISTPGAVVVHGQQIGNPGQMKIAAPRR